MNNLEKSPAVGTQKMTAGSLIRWIIGIFLILIGLGSLTSSFLLSIFNFLLAAIAIPPSAKYIQEKFGHFGPDKIKAQNPAEKVCPSCKANIPFDAKACRFCGAKQKQKSNAALLVLVLIGTIWIVTIFTGSLSPSNSSSTTSVPAASLVKIGETGYLESGSESVLVGTTKDNYDEAMKLAVAHDNEGVARMVLTGQVLLVDNGTKVRVIDAGFFSVQIRILEGSNYGESGWVPTEFVKSKK